MTFESLSMRSAFLGALVRPYSSDQHVNHIIEDACTRLDRNSNRAQQIMLFDHVALSYYFVMLLILLLGHFTCFSEHPVGST